MSTRDEVEAVLLNSEGDPVQETKDALYAVVRFAMLECDATELALEEALGEAVAKVRKNEGLGSEE